jgi:ubiquinone biosynthesis protein
VPADFVTQFEKLHDRVQPLPFEIIEQVLKDEFGPALYEKFISFDPAPLGSASIAQVHKARLADGTDVVVKVQRPGLIQKINDDLNVLYFLAELLETYVPETRAFSPMGIVDEYFKTLDLETNFVVEANNLRRFSQNFKSDPNIKIPKVYFDLTTEKVLTLEALNGVPLSAENSLRQEGIDTAEVIRRGLRAYLKMVFIDGLFHGDLHAGNFFVLPNNQIGLIDFGVVGRLNNKAQSGIASMLMALAKEDYERMAYDFIDLAPFDETIDADKFAKELRDLIAPFYGLTLKNVNLGRLLMDSSSIAAKNNIIVPTELMMFFKSLVHIESLGKKIHPEFDFLSYSLEFAGELVKNQYDPNRMVQDLAQVARDSKSLLSHLPRQLHFMLKKVNSPGHAFRMQIKELEDIKKSIESSFNLLFLGVIIAALLMSASIIYILPTENHIYGIPTMSFAGYWFAVILGIIAFINYIRK